MSNRFIGSNIQTNRSIDQSVKWLHNRHTIPAR